MKFLREEVTDCNAVDGAWLRDSCRRLSFYKASCDASLALECSFWTGNFEFRDLIGEIELRGYEEMETADIIVFTFSSY